MLELVILSLTKDRKFNQLLLEFKGKLTKLILAPYFSIKSSANGAKILHTKKQKNN